jgi:hypothetical protein
MLTEKSSESWKAASNDDEQNEQDEYSSDIGVTVNHHQLRPRRRHDERGLLIGSVKVDIGVTRLVNNWRRHWHCHWHRHHCFGRKRLLIDGLRHRHWHWHWHLWSLISGSGIAWLGMLHGQAPPLYNGRQHRSAS